MQDNFHTQAETLRNKYLLKTEDFFVANRQALTANFAKNFLQVCGHIVELQKTASLPKVYHLEYIMDYGDFVERNYTASVWVFGEYWYSDRNRRVVGEHSVNGLFTHFNEMWDELLTLRKKYPQESALTVKDIMITAMSDFYSYLADIAKIAIAECVDEPLFEDIEKGTTFKIRAGEYMNPQKSQLIYTMGDNSTKNSEALARWFGERLENEYTRGDYADLDFSKHSFEYTDLRYSRFDECYFDDGSLAGSLLTGTNFRKAQMENCKLDNCTIYEADFSYATLIGTRFINVKGSAGLPDKEKWTHPGYFPVRFRFADLTDADFTGADLKGADFTGANLTGTNFTDAILDNAIFDGSIGRRV